MIQAAHLAPSCFNNQPWRFVAIDEPRMLGSLYPALGSSNGWMRHSPVILAVASHRDLDCRSSDGRDYFAFDCGLALGMLVIQAWHMGYVAHPVAGYKPRAIKKLLGIPDDYTLITLVNIGRKGDDHSLLDADQRERETGPRVRRPLTEVLSWNRFEQSPSPP